MGSCFWRYIFRSKLVFADKRRRWWRTPERLAAKSTLCTCPNDGDALEVFGLRGMGQGQRVGYAPVGEL